MLGLCSNKFDQIERMHTEVQIKGRSFHSMDQLEQTQKSCEDIWKLGKSVEEYLVSLKRTAALPIIPEAAV